MLSKLFLGKAKITFECLPAGYKYLGSKQKATSLIEVLSCPVVEAFKAYRCAVESVQVLAKEPG
jgi:hypothetical protein